MKANIRELLKYKEQTLGLSDLPKPITKPISKANFGNKYTTQIIVKSEKDYIEIFYIPKNDKVKITENIISIKSQLYIQAREAYLNNSRYFKAGESKYELIDFICENTLRDPELHIDILFVYKKDMKRYHKHTLEDINVKVLSLRNNNYIYIDVEYCKKCDKHYISLDNLKYYQENKGLFAIKLDDHLVKYNNTHSINYSNSYSILNIYGYNASANGPSTAERQGIINYLLEEGILNKLEIFAHISWLINDRGHRMAQALTKWQQDLASLTQTKKEGKSEITTMDIQTIK